MNKINHRINVFSIIVVYNPNINRLKALIDNVLSANSKVIIVDNTKYSYIQHLAQIEGVQLLELNDNLGIAKAQNIGIQKAIASGAEAVVFFDQDSKVEEEFIENLTVNFTTGQPMIASPVFYDEEKGFKFPSIKLNKFGLFTFFYPKIDDKPFLVDVVISSGSAATKAVFDKAGFMDENYFIDFVDTEWSLRCRSMGIPIFTIPKAKMIHTIGNKSVNLYIMRVFIHSPIRTYYKVRNAFIFFNNKNVSVALGVKEVITALVHNLVTIVIVKDKRIYFKHYFQAIVDGLTGVKGKKIIK